MIFDGLIIYRLVVEHYWRNNRILPDLLFINQLIVDYSIICFDINRCIIVYYSFNNRIVFDKLVINRLLFDHSGINRLVPNLI